MLFKQSWTLNNNLVLKVNGEIEQKKNLLNKLALN